MKTLVTYSSLTGNTKKLAEGIFEALEHTEKEILPIAQATDLSDYDVVIAGYWVDKGGPNQEAEAFLRSLSGKSVGIFATLAYWPDSDHAFESLKNGEKLVAGNNTVLAKFICQGKLSERVIAQFKKLPPDNPHAIAPEKLLRYEIAANHPSVADISRAAELFNERLRTLCSTQD